MLLTVVGPTAIGKSKLAIDLAIALDGEIISADSMQIYKGLNIGTAKVTANEAKDIPHRLIDIIECSGEYSVNQFITDAKNALDEIEKKKKQPILCGGTGLFIKAFLYGYNLAAAPKSNDVRDKYKRLLIEHNAEYIYGILYEKNPQAATKLHSNDTKRVIRALEIIESGGKKSDSDNKLIIPSKIYALDCDRQVLYERINARVDRMIDEGLLDEVKQLKDFGLTRENQAMQSIGYKEIFSFLDKKITFDEAVNLIKKNTRNYAKRQLTFFRGIKDAVWINVNEDLSRAFDFIMSDFRNQNVQN